VPDGQQLETGEALAEAGEARFTIRCSHAGEGRRCGTCRWMKVGPDNSVGANQRVIPAYSPPPPARKPVWPLHASPGWDPSVRRTSRTCLGICPQLCPCAAVRPGGGFPSFCPEKAQIEFACAGAAVGFPLPVTSPANAEPAPTAATATAQSAAASNDLKRICLPPHLGPRGSHASVGPIRVIAHPYHRQRRCAMRNSSKRRDQLRRRAIGRFRREGRSSPVASW
jgi:hypothetical protein